MIKLRIPMLKSKSRLKLVSCCHCGSEFYVSPKNIRVANYCSSC